jgi:hypothetical protein
MSQFTINIPLHLAASRTGRAAFIGVTITDKSGVAHTRVTGAVETTTPGTYNMPVPFDTDWLPATYIVDDSGEVLSMLGDCRVNWADAPREATDPLANEVPGDYAEGTAGHAISLLIATAEAPPVAVVPAPVDPARTMAYLDTYDARGVILPRAELVIELVTPPANRTAGVSFEQTYRVASDASGRLEIELLRGATYRAQRKGGEWVEFTTPDANSYALPRVLGG